VNITPYLSFNVTPLKLVNANRCPFLLLAILVLVSNSMAHAQSFRGQPLRLGETTFIPEVRLDYVSVDNAFNSNTNVQHQTPNRRVEIDLIAE